MSHGRKKSGQKECCDAGEKINFEEILKKIENEKLKK